MPNWIFVITSAYAEFERRINKKTWPIYKNTANKTKLRAGHNVIFYQGGNEGKKFLGSARVDSGLIPNGTLDYSVRLSNIKVWKNPVSIKDILADLNFISHKDRWGIHLQGGVIHLPDDDFDIILSNAKKSDT